jgi:hypothetical protein
MHSHLLAERLRVRRGRRNFGLLELLAQLLCLFGNRVLTAFELLVQRARLTVSVDRLLQRWVIGLHAARDVEVRNAPRRRALERQRRKEHADCREYASIWGSKQRQGARPPAARSPHHSLMLLTRPSTNLLRMVFKENHPDLLILVFPSPTKLVYENHA